MMITIEFGDDTVAYEKEAYQIVMDALLEFSARRGCRSAGAADETARGASAYVLERHDDGALRSLELSPALHQRVEEKIEQVARRATAARLAIVRLPGMS
jgi:alkylation response protein AidB-like acyl-CoA dehydrogenase